MIWLPGYGLYPSSWLRRASEVRFQGQANREMLETESMGDVPAHVEEARQSLERHFGVSGGGTQPWYIGSGITTVGIQRWIASGRKGKLEDFADERDAIEIMVHEDPRWDEVARRIPPAVNGVPVFVWRTGIPVALSDIDWSKWCAPCGNCGKQRPQTGTPCPHCGANAGWAKCGGRKCRPGDLGDVEGRPDDDSTAMAHNWTGTRGGWYDYAGPDVTPGGADNMNDVSNVPIHMLVTGPTLKELLLDTVRAHGGSYMPVDGEWRFFLDPILRVKLALAGLPAPCSVRAEPLVCLRSPPPLPGIGGFIHPGVGVYCRPAGIPAGLMERYRVVLSNASTFGMADIGDLSSAERAAEAFNKSIGINGSSKPAWWLYTLPRLTTSGAPEVVIGVAGDVAMDRELPASFMGVPLVREIAYRKQGMGSAPIDTVWPTDSPDYHEPTGPGTGDDDPAIGDLTTTPDGQLSRSAGRPARVRRGSADMARVRDRIGKVRARDASKEADVGVNGAFVTMKDLVSSGLNKQDPSWGDDGVVISMPKGSGRILMGQEVEQWTPALDVTREINGELVQSMPDGSATVSDYSFGDAEGVGDINWNGQIRRVQSMPRETFSGQGCPIQPMQTGGLNRGIPTGYEGQPWVNKDWNMGDVTAAVGETKKLLRPGRLLGAAVGAAAGWVAVKKFAPEGEVPGSIAKTVAAAIGAVSGLIVANAASTALE